MSTRYLRAILYCVVLMMFMAVTSCSDDEESSDASNEVQCGPNSSLHAGLGVEPHCDCWDGFSLYDGVCVPDDTVASSNNTTGTTTPSDTTSGGNTSDSAQRALPLACWVPPGSLCDPRDGEGCDLAAGDTCDLAENAAGSLGIGCLPGPNTQAVDAACDPAAGPFCAPGMHCHDRTCKHFCCSDSECDAGTRCEPFSANVGSLGVCTSGSTTTPMCGSAGASCQIASDCCSNDCHIGHCH
ncbi:MAG: hypothetical protein AAFS10_19295 [Myxococcota bacterium]